MSSFQKGRTGGKKQARVSAASKSSGAKKTGGCSRRKAEPPATRIAQTLTCLSGRQGGSGLTRSKSCRLSQWHYGIQISFPKGTILKSRMTRQSPGH